MDGARDSGVGARGDAAAVQFAWRRGRRSGSGKEGESERWVLAASARPSVSLSGGAAATAAMRERAKACGLKRFF